MSEDLSSTSFGLTSYQEKSDDGYEVAHFTGMHSQGGGCGTTLRFDVELRRFRGHAKWEAKLNFDECEAESVAEVLVRLAGWTTRAAASLNAAAKAKEGESLPLGSSLW